MASAHSNAHPHPRPHPLGGHASLRRQQQQRHAADDDGAAGHSSTTVAHTLTACTRCRQRKTRCDPGLPRCTPCERTNSTCEYYDSNRGCNVNRNYVVYLQHKVRELEIELHRVENEEFGDDPDTMTHAATVRMHEATESKYLGPSSGIAITRLVMQLAKQFTDARSIKDIVPDQRARAIKELYDQEQAKPTSKVYPLISDVAAMDLPNRDLTDLLVQVYKLKVQPMYPALHEPTLDQDVNIVYSSPAKATAYQHLVCRMVIAISLQKMDTQYAGLADSYYLAALKYMEPVVRPMDLKTLQCFALMAEYSLLTPTRTAIYYVMGIAVRLAQALGLNEEKTIVRGLADGSVSALEVDLRRRLFWCVLVMDFGLAHTLGRPAMLATHQDHIDVDWFASCDDEYITPQGIVENAPRPSIKKWAAIHFFKMRLHQLEIRRKLYLRRRDEPTDDTHPWFLRMDAKLTAWRDAAPTEDGGLGIGKDWFNARYNTMVVFLYRPSPQVPRPSVKAALKCFEACQYSIYSQRDQITNKSVDLTWVFTQILFMAVNTILWSLSYVEVRRAHRREEVEQHLTVAMDAIELTAERWPGVASAVQLYQYLTTAILKAYEKDEDIPISAASPEDSASPGSTIVDAHARSRTASPASASTHSIATPPAQRISYNGYVPQRQSLNNLDQPALGTMPTDRPQSFMDATPPAQPRSMTFLQQHTSSPPPQNLQGVPSGVQPLPPPQFQSYDATHPFHGLPNFMPDLTVPSWSASRKGSLDNYFGSRKGSLNNLFYSSTGPNGGGEEPQLALSQFPNLAASLDPSVTAYQYPAAASSLDDPMGLQQNYWEMDSGDFGNGLNLQQQEELMRALQTDGVVDIQTLLSNTLAAMQAPRSTA